MISVKVAVVLGNERFYSKVFGGLPSISQIRYCILVVAIGLDAVWFHF